MREPPNTTVPHLDPALVEKRSRV